MLMSMTGYGAADFTLKRGGFPELYSIEVKSLNSRYLDISVRMPDRFSALEFNIRSAVKNRFSRGSFTVLIISRGSLGGEGAGGLKLNIARAKAYMEAARELKEKLKVEGSIDAGLLLRMKDIFIFSSEDEGDVENDWKMLEEGLKNALDSVASFREKEGGAIKEDIETRLVSIKELVKDIERLAPLAVKRYRERLETELGELLKGIDESRLIAEAAILAERIDFSEEIMRLCLHMEKMQDYLSRPMLGHPSERMGRGSPEPVGRRLDFLCQELLREANTIASKSHEALVTRAVVEVKGELEKIREQAQNVE